MHEHISPHLLKTKEQEIPRPLDLVKEYGYLALQRNPSEKCQERMFQILQAAESDAVLNFWLDEVEHFLAHKQERMSEEGKIEIERIVDRMSRKLHSQ